MAMLLAGCMGASVHTATYASFAEARAAGAVDTGLVPSILPHEAYELRAAYAVDGPQRWGLFNFRETDTEALRAVLHADEIPFAGIEMEIPGRIEWWPVILRGKLDAERIQATGLRAYRVRSGDMIIAVSWKQGRAYYWTQ